MEFYKWVTDNLKNNLQNFHHKKKYLFMTEDISDLRFILMSDKYLKEVLKIYQTEIYSNYIEKDPEYVIQHPEEFKINNKIQTVALTTEVESASVLLDEEVFKNFDPTDHILATPFDSVWVETVSPENIIMSQIFKSKDTNKTYVNELRGFKIKQDPINPRNFGMLLVVDVVTLENIEGTYGETSRQRQLIFVEDYLKELEIINKSSNPADQDFLYTMNRYLTFIFALFEYKKMYLCEYRVPSFKIKTKDENVFIKKVIYVNSVKSLNPEDEPALGIFKKMQEHKEFTHRFEVSAHWRKMKDPESLGLNRAGVRCVVGRTWIKKHERGTGDLVVKTRILNNIKLEARSL